MVRRLNMKKNGYTLIELIILIGALGVITLLIVPKLSTAFYNNNVELYQSRLNIYLHSATLYGNNVVKEDVKTNDNYIITIKDLVDAGYVTLTDGEDILDVNGNSMLGIKIKLYYDSSNDSVYAEILD